MNFIQIVLIIALAAKAGAFISAILPSKEKWKELKRQTEERRKKYFFAISPNQTSLVLY